MSESQVAPVLQEPGGWRIVRQFIHSKTICSPGDAIPPDLPMAEIERLARAGHIRPKTGDNPFPARQPGAPTTAREYLKATDQGVLLNIRRFRPRKPVVMNILLLAEREGRTQILLEALRLHLDLPVPKPK